MSSPDAGGVSSLGARELVVIVPAFQEGRSIARVVRDVRSVVPEATIVVVNDGSTDATASEARGAHAVVLDLPFNLGIGGAVQTGLRYARRGRFRVAVQVDGDGQHPAEGILTIVAPVARNEADLVIGSRFMEIESFRSTAARRIGITGLSWLIRILSGLSVKDVTSGFRAFGPAAIELLADAYPEDFPEPESILILRRHGLRCLEVAVPMRERESGHSSISGFRSIYYMIKVALALSIDRLRIPDRDHVYPRR